MNYFTSQKLYCRPFSGGPVFLNIIFDFSGIFHPFGVVTRAIHCYEKKKKGQCQTIGVMGCRKK